MIVIVAGIAGSGKTTVGERLARRMGCEFADGDRFHSAAAVAKMHAGVPLTDDDRWPWLDAIGAWMDQEDAAGRSAVVACSALKRSYRQRLITGRPELRMFFLIVEHERGRGPADHPARPLLPGKAAGQPVRDAGAARAVRGGHAGADHWHAGPDGR